MSGKSRQRLFCLRILCICLLHGIKLLKGNRQALPKPENLNGHNTIHTISITSMTSREQQIRLQARLMSSNTTENFFHWFLKNLHPCWFCSFIVLHQRGSPQENAINSAHLTWVKWRECDGFEFFASMEFWTSTIQLNHQHDDEGIKSIELHSKTQ